MVKGGKHKKQKSEIKPFKLLLVPLATVAGVSAATACLLASLGSGVSEAPRRLQSSNRESLEVGRPVEASRVLKTVERPVSENRGVAEEQREHTDRFGEGTVGGSAFPHAFFGLSSSKVEEVPEREELPIVNMGGSCENQTQLEAFVDQGRVKLRERALRRFDQSLFLSEWIQFWQVSGYYLQVRLVWEMDDPPTYRIEAYRSPDTEMRSAVRDESFFSWISPHGVTNTGRYPLDAVLRLIRAYLRERVAEGALLGTRFARVLLDRHTEEFREIMFEDSRVVALRSRAVACTAVPYGVETRAASGSSSGVNLRLICGCSNLMKAAKGADEDGAARDSFGSYP